MKAGAEPVTAPPSDAQEHEQPQEESERRATGVLGRLSSHLLGSSGTFAIFVAVFIVYAIVLGSRYTNPEARLLDIHQNVPVLLIAFAATICLIAGEFDLSVASMATLTTYLTIGLTINQHVSFPIVVLTCLAVGVGGGVLNACLVLRFRVSAFIATLATGGIFEGFSLVYSNGAPISPSLESSGLPTWFSGMGSFGSYQTKAPEWLTIVLLVILAAAAARALAEELDLPQRWYQLGIFAIDAAVLIVLATTVLRSVTRVVPDLLIFLMAVVLVLWFTLRYTTFGRYLYATGGNAAAAQLAGVRVHRLKAASFVLSGLLASLAGVVLAGIQGSAVPGIAAGYLLPAFAAAFLSTVLLSSGKFHIFGTLLGGVFLLWVSQGLIIAGAPFTWTEVINGVVLAAAVAVSMGWQRR